MHGGVLMGGNIGRMLCNGWIFIQTRIMPNFEKNIFMFSYSDFILLYSLLLMHY